MAYVFVHLLPELVSGGSELSETIGMIHYAPTNFVEVHSFFVAFLGVLVVFSIDVLAQHQMSLSSISSWLHLSSFAPTNYLYAYSLPSLISAGILYGFIYSCGSHSCFACRSFLGDSESQAIPSA